MKLGSIGTENDEYGSHFLSATENIFTFQSQQLKEVFICFSIISREEIQELNILIGRKARLITLIMTLYSPRGAI